MPTASNPVAHTPGPWELIALSDRLYVQSKGQSLIADVGGTKIMDLIPTPLANARLIAAAPEMLEALEEICADALADGHDVPEAEAMEKGLAAIHKARD